MENNNEIIIYQTEDGKSKIQVHMANESVWLTQMQMAELFQRDRSVITKHINNAINEGELDKKRNVQILHIANSDKPTAFYNLEVIISVGYRVKSLRGAQFRRWATDVLREYLVKGFAMNDDLLKLAGGGQYWKELLERIRDIRSSEKIFYRQILDLYATSADYDPRTDESQMFFKIVQNKFHYAVHEHTASEIIYDRADSAQPFMGLKTFSSNKPKKSDVGIAKNYLSEEELAILNRMVSAFFDLAELQALNRKPMYMKDWLAAVDDFAQRYGKGILPNAGKISHRQALEKAETEYEIYHKKIANELTQVEKDYLESIKQTQKKIERKQKKK